VAIKEYGDKSYKRYSFYSHYAARNRSGAAKLWPSRHELYFVHATSISNLCLGDDGNAENVRGASLSLNVSTGDDDRFARFADTLTLSPLDSLINNMLGTAH
jgi:hypothetical protein